jgi:hypothetical protein
MESVVGLERLDSSFSKALRERVLSVPLESFRTTTPGLFGLITLPLIGRRLGAGAIYSALDVVSET